MRILGLDLTSFDSIRQAAEVVNAYDDNIDILINNVGVMNTRSGHSVRMASRCI
jgi:short-subunit dehydrogenase